jgi:diguanylate cyclase (GGDEF)-like protein
LKAKGGRIIYALISTTVVFGKLNKPEYIFAFISDISDRRKAEENIRHMAYHDALTDLPNRKLFQQRFDVLAREVKQTGLRLALIFLDLDNFKDVNDSYGHDTGDLMICEVARRLQSRIGKNDIVTRIGGDEFIVLLANVENESQALAAAAAIQNGLTDVVEVNGYRILVESSMGVSIFPDDGERLDVLLKNADDAMYAVKRTGRNNIRLYTQEKIC